MFSVVIPTKNEEGTLPLLLESIRQQTLQPAEVIIADAFSSDRTKEIALGFGAKIVDGGLPAVGRNAGAMAAKEPIILFLDADVQLTDQHILEKALGEFFEKKLDVATCDVKPLSDSLVDTVMHEAYNKYVRAVEPMIQHAPGFFIFVTKKLHEQIGGFDETITFCEDHDYAQRAAKAGNFGFLSVKIPVSVRRFDRDGRVRIAAKFLAAEIHLATIGPIRNNLFKYSFGHKKTPKA